ncbi:hypothetical protein PHELEMICH_55 [Mycobacterium phage Phelemich]|uniref:DUF6378 domain-containing protein n=2 Tax=Acadianvirus reprobate TaxID=1982903 RepID=S5Y1B9_9CAUD|nr:hypothetical protein N847_gp55 [Mycobacterium phage Phelemich]YP_008409977.1 hypothetical protein REPROBATE_56 [Mycobacterium phage Reprobate]AGT12792.1 hypothetical protein REPROBATE_56 [Mycobacterium phage Reprobate]AGT13969.1 hypothetical protein PHELEMICH_55 [Mycobacterium phage Phelemich]
MRHTLHEPGCEFLRPDGIACTCGAFEREIAAAGRPTTTKETPMGYDPAHDYDDNPPIMNHTEGAPHSLGVEGRTCGRCGQPIKADQINAEVEPGRFIHVMCPSYHYVLEQHPPKPTGVYAAQVAQEAIDLFTGPRNTDYGDATDNFTDIADLWTVVLRPVLQPGARLTAEQVAIMSALIKVARLNNTPDHDDSWTDSVAYLALGAGINRRRQA